MSIRREVLNVLYQSIEHQGTITLSKRGRTEAISNLEAALKNYEAARRKLLVHELALHYRVAIFGSARLEEGSEEFQFVSKLAKELVEAREIDIVTGGGPGIMKAANFGAVAGERARTNRRGVRNRSHGLTIQLPSKKGVNDFVHFQSNHPEFSTRLQAFLDITHAAYFAPGGVGTLLEMLMVVQTRQVNHLEINYPTIANPFWRPQVETWNDELYHQREARGRPPLISASDLEIIHFSDDISEIVQTIAQNHDLWKKNIKNHIKRVP